MKILIWVIRYRLEVINFFVGAVVLTFELTATRIAAPYIGMTIYVWTSIIGTILAALAIGYALGGYLADKRKNPQDIVILLLLAGLLIFIVNLIKDWFLHQIGQVSWSLQLQAFIASMVLFAAPTVVLGSISPYLARLSIKDVRTSGRHLSRISAAGTVGSLVGAFATGYFLFGFIGTRYILDVLAFCLILVSFLISPRFLLPHKLLAILGLILVLFLPPKVHLSGLFRDIDTDYNRVVVRELSLEKRPVLVMQTDSSLWQSGIYLDNDNSLVFQYAKAFAYVAKTLDNPQDFLVMGGGAFTIPSYLAQTYPAVRIDTVEIDDQMESISQRYFGYKNRANLNVIKADGRQFLNRNSRQYNAIFMDVFVSYIPPFQLLTKEAAAQYGKALNPDGLLAINIVSPVEGPGRSFVESVVSTFRQVFNHIEVYRMSPDTDPTVRQNLIILASQNTIDFEGVSASSPDEAPLFGYKVQFTDKVGLVLSDDFAPVERLSASSH